ncbi:polycystin-1-like protein 1 [Ctenodactylus gundi]
MAGQCPEGWDLYVCLALPWNSKEPQVVWGDAISVYTNGTVFATDTDITFVAVTEDPAPLEFTWHFGDGPPVRTASRSICRRLSTPQWYRVTVTASSGNHSVVSEPHLIRVQRKIVPNRLVSTPTALVNTSVAFQCRINFGTDITYLWDFGDGTVQMGSGSSSHIYSREGEFTVEVLTFNHISSATLRARIFVLQEPCQPPPVKNMGPKTVQTWRSRPLRLGVTFEAAVLCNMSQGLEYTWSFVDSEGSPVALPATVNTRRQSVLLPGCALEVGSYTAIAKVQVSGSLVHSTYSVGVEVRARAPVAIIAEGTHLFIPTASAVPVVLTGSQSYDPDYPEAALSYHWTCTAASSPGWPCFDGTPTHQPDAGVPTLSFTAKWLSACCDQFLVSLIVTSGGRSSSEAQVFLSTRPDPSFRFIHISWADSQDVVPWNMELSLRAVCEDCGDGRALSYAWELYLVNATEDRSREGKAAPSCGTVMLLGASALGDVLRTPESDMPATAPSKAGPNGASMPSSREFLPTGWPGLEVMGSISMESTGDGHWIPAAGSSVGQGLPSGDAPPGAELGVLDEGALTPSPSAGSMALPGSSSLLDVSSAGLPGSGLDEGIKESPGDGDNLLDPFLLTITPRPTLLIDWPKTLVRPAVFQGYTSTGVTEPTVTIKPYSLSSGKTYALQVSVASSHGCRGRAQLYLKVAHAPRDVACQVQPPHGLEAHTVFSIFCMSGAPDFEYEFSYHIGSTSRHTLYRGRDTQHYFALPAGDPLDGHKVTISTEITDGRGSKAQPCSVVVTVLPRYHGTDCSSEDLYNSTLENLSTLQRMGSDTEVRSYVAMVTRILGRLAEKSSSTCCGQWDRMQDVLVSSVCSLTPLDQEEATDAVRTLRDLVSLPNKLSFVSAAHILSYARTLRAHSPGLSSWRSVTGTGLGRQLLFLISEVWDASEQGRLESEDYVQEEGMKVISDMLLSTLSLSRKPQLHVSAGKMEVQALVHRDLQSSVQSLGSVLVHLPRDLAVPHPATSPCCTSLLMLFRESPYPQGRAPGKVGSVAVLTLHNCSGQSPVPRGRLRAPVTVDFGEEADPGPERNETTFVLLPGRANIHQFMGLSEDPRDVLQIDVEFSVPTARAFPVLLLVRFSEPPTPSDFLVRHTFSWEKQNIQILAPAALKRGVWLAQLPGDTWGSGADVGYLTLLDAGYDRTPPTTHVAVTVSYSVRLQWSRCVLRDRQAWRATSLPPQPGASPRTVSCSYDRLVPFAILRRKLEACLEVRDVSEFQSPPQNLLPGLFAVAAAVLYGVLAAKHRSADHHEKKKAGHIFLQEATPPGHQLYAVVIDTGFQSPAQFTSRVFIVLCGENGFSEPKELSCREKPLFERNSRHTFILSASDQLGPLRKIRLWHDSCGESPSWFLSHVMVQELRSGRGWFFPAQCWLAAGRGDGRVHRELACLRRGPSFCKLFYSEFAASLEDFHVWLSLCSQPPSSSFLPTQRLAVAYCLLCVHTCLAALVITGGHEQPQLAIGPTDITPRSFGLGLLCSVLASLVAQLLSLPFRLSKHPESAVVPGSDVARRKIAGDRGAAGQPLESEASFRDLREKSPCCPPHFQAPSSDLEGLTPLGSRVRVLWSSTAAWAACGLMSLACVLGTGFLGYRLSPTQYQRWLLLLSLSVLCCALVTQPLLICLMALGFAWRRRDDSQFFMASLREATRGLDSATGGWPGAPTPLPPHRCLPNLTEAQKVLAARQQERHLRWARPPSKAQLRTIRGRMRRDMHTQMALRDVCMCFGALLLLCAMTYGNLSLAEFSLGRAIRKQFLRNSHLRHVEDWWQWSMTTLLDGLLPQAPSGAGVQRTQPGALAGQCYLMGTLLVQQVRAPHSPPCKPPWQAPALMAATLPPRSPKGQDHENGSGSVSPGGCGLRRESCTHSLGRTRLEAQASLTALRAGRWLDGRTRAVSVHFTLYNPPSRLLTRVTLRAEVLPTGGLIPSAHVESFSIFHEDSSPWYGYMLLKLAFLFLLLAQLCLQLSQVIEEGVLSYGRRPRSWLELLGAAVALAYYAASGHLTTLAADVADKIHEGPCQALDLSLVALWTQRTHWLQGLLLFLWMWKCISLPSLLDTMTPCFSRLRCSISAICAPVLAGAVLLAAYTHLRWLLTVTWALPPGTTFEGSLLRLLAGFPGRSQEAPPGGPSLSEQRAPALCYTAALTVTAALCLGTMRGSLVACFQKRFSRRKSLVRLQDVAACAWQKALALLGLQMTKVEETVMAMHPTHYLDEFAMVLDELLWKVNNLSDSIDLPDLEQPRRTEEAEAEDGPVSGVAGHQATGAWGEADPGVVSPTVDHNSDLQDGQLVPVHTVVTDN